MCVCVCMCVIEGVRDTKVPFHAWLNEIHVLTR